MGQCESTKSMPAQMDINKPFTEETHIDFWSCWQLYTLLMFFLAKKKKKKKKKSTQPCNQKSPAKINHPKQNIFFHF